MPNSLNLNLLEHHVRLTREARTVLAHHRFDPLLRQPIFAGMTLPKFSSRAEGCRVWDILGREFIDWTGGIDSNLFGHRHPVVVETIKRWAVNQPQHELDPPANGDGPFTDPKELRIAQQLRSIFGEELLVGFTRGRNEAVYCATEIARTQTGRPKIAFHEVHSTRPLYAEDQRFRFNRSHFEDDNFRPVPLNDLQSLSWLLESNANQFAAFFLCPSGFADPHAGYYQEMCQTLARHGTLLILDESETAFRLTNAGVQKHLSVAPDLTVVGENLGGPFAFSAIVGKPNLLSKAWKSTLKTVDRPAGLTLDVVEAALVAVTSNALPSRLNHTGSQLQDDVNDYAEAEGLPFRLIGHPTRMTFHSGKHEFLTPEQILAAFCISALQNGLVTHGEFWPNIAHDKDALLKTIRAVSSAFELTMQWMESLQRPDQAVGEPFRPHEIRGRIDSLNMIRKTMLLTGWILVDGEPVQISATNEAGDRVEAKPVHRGDLEINMPDVRDAAKAGFQLELEVESIKKPSRFLLEGRRNNEVLYTTFLTHDPGDNTSGPYPFGDGYLFT